MSDGHVRVPDERLDELADRAKQSIDAAPYAYGFGPNAPAVPVPPGELAALVADLRAARADNQRLRETLSRVIDELGVPGVGYPAPVANAHAIARAALAEEPCV